MQTLFNSFIIQLILSGVLFVMAGYLIIKNAGLKKKIQTAVSKAKSKESK